MVWNDVQKIYLPHGRDWLKSNLLLSIKVMSRKIEDEEIEDADD